MPGKRSTLIALTNAPGTTSVTRAAKSSRIFEIAAASYDLSCAAVASATIAGALSVPLLISRSCPPPCNKAGISTPRRNTSTPIPSGPPILCALIDSAITPSDLNESGIFLKLWAASV